MEREVKIKKNNKICLGTKKRVTRNALSRIKKITSADAARFPALGGHWQRGRGDVEEGDEMGGSNKLAGMGGGQECRVLRGGRGSNGATINPGNGLGKKRILEERREDSRRREKR